MIHINNFTINSDSTEINVSVETDVNYIISSAIVWTDETFKDYNQAIDVSNYLTGTSNIENFTLPASLFEVDKLKGIYFIEFETTSDVEETCESCSNNLGVATSLISFKECLLNKILEYSVCEGYNSSPCLNQLLCDIYNINILMEALKISLEFGYYGEAIDILTTLKKLCKNSEGCVECGECSDCDNLPTPVFKSGLDYGTLDGNLILV